MCGLVGIAGALEYKDEAAMKRLLVLNWFRGPDSTGLAAIRNNGEVKISKLPSHPLDLFDLGKFKTTLSGQNSVAFLGHNRAATRGVVNHTNAHPFEIDHIVGAHNGTLDWSCQDDLEKMLGEKFPVDSKTIIAAIAAFGIEETIKNLRGSWAITYFNLKDGTLNFIRNADRPMWFAYSDNFKKLYWASEFPMIYGAVYGGNGNPYETLYKDAKGNVFFATEENVHYSFNIDELKKGGTSRPKPKTKKLEGKKPFLSSVGPGAVHDPFKRRVLTEEEKASGKVIPISQTTSYRGTSDTHKSAKDSAAVLFHHIDTPHEEPTAGRISKEKFEQLAKYGCSFCANQIEWGDEGVSIFERDDIILCPTCTSQNSKENPVTRIYLENFAS